MRRRQRNQMCSARAGAPNWALQRPATRVARPGRSGIERSAEVLEELRAVSELVGDL